MRVLFYVEPLVERENPTWKAGWVEHFVKKISAALLAEGIAEADLACLVPTALGAAARKVLPGSRVVSIDQTELVPRFGGSALAVASAWYKSTASDQALFDMASLVKERLGDFAPTCCITFSPAPYLKAAWPDAQVLHMECGFLSRPPYPETVYFDPYGMFSDSALARFAVELRERVSSGDERALLSDVREHFCKLGQEQPNPFADLMAGALGQFESAVLLALQFSNFYAYDANARFADQYDLLVHTLESVPRGIAVVVCEHPEHPVLNPQTTAYLRSRYPNFVWHPLFRQVYGASHYLMPFVQGVVTVSSSVGLHALLWKKKLAVLGGGHLAAVSDTCEVSDLAPLLGGAWSEEKDRILCWLLSSFHLPLDGLLTSGRLSQYFRALTPGEFGTVEEARASVGLDVDKLREFYDLAWKKRPMSPYGTAKAIDGNDFYAALYVASEGRAYDEQCCLRQFVSQLSGEEVCLNFTLDRENKNPISVRFDPTNRSGFLQMRELALLDARGVMLWKWGGGICGIRAYRGVSVFDNAEGALLLCNDDDPQIELDIDFSQYAHAPRPLVVRARVASVGLSAVGKQLSEREGMITSLNQAVTERDTQITSLNQAVTERDVQITSLNQAVTERDVQITSLNQAAVERDRQIAHLHQEVGARDSQIAALKHEVRTQLEQFEKIMQSSSWRLTKPLRGVRRSLSIGSSSVLRGMLSDRARQVWRHLPISVSNKQKLKSAIFQGVPFLFRHTLAYRSWANGQRGETRAANPVFLAPKLANVLEPVTYVPLLQAKPLPQRQAKLICFYLPQFHAFPENDAWWGKGFTEWTNVLPAQPHFEGHYQPHLSGELGNYNLLDPAVQRRQVELAKLYGIEGFCFYFYWFAGHRLMEQPIRNFMNDSEIDLPFCLCWANENWSRRWDGLDSEILIAQEHSAEDDLAFIAHIADYLQSPRYVRVDGKPLLLVYRPSLLPSAKQTAQRWRDWCRDNGIGEIYLAYTQSFEVVDPAKYGFDAAIEFPPNNSAPPNITDSVVPLRDDFAATVYDWRVFVERSEQYKQPDYKLYRSVCPAWDNTARRKNRGTIFQNSSPKLYQRWLENAINYTAQQSPDPDQRLIFVNAWNEWAEGAHLEPDQRYGYAYLQATRDALSATSHQQLGSLLLVTHDCHPHGAQFLILETAKELRDCGFKVYILALGGGRLLDDFIVVGDTLCAESVGPEATAAFLQMVRSAGASHAITSTVVCGSVVPQLKQIGFKVLSLIHELPGVIRDMRQENNAALIAAHSDKVVFPADLVRQKFNEIAAVDRARTLVRHQGVVRKNPYKLRREEAQRLVCAKHQLAVGTQIVLSIAFMDRRKGPDLFVEMAAQVLAQRSNTAFIWIGHADREMEQQVRQRIAALGLEGNVILAGFERDPLMYYAAASVYALTSREDPFPNVVLESAEAGTPVVAFTSTTGASEFIVAHQGMLAEHLDVADFACKVCQLLATPASVTASDVSLRRYALDLVHHLNGMSRVSVVVPNYKYERYIGLRLDSIFQQTYPIYEVIVLDDASPDGSVAAIKDYMARHSREARLIVNEVNSGSVFRQWEKGVAACTGDLVWIAEADDLSEPGFLQELAPAFTDPQLMLAYCQSKQMDAAGTVLADSYLEYTLSTSDCCLTDYFREGKEEIVKSMCIKNTIPNVSAVLMRRSALQQTLDELAQRLCEMKVAGDWLVYLHIMMQGKVCHSKKPLNLHRRHDGSVTGALEKQRHIEEIIQMQKMGISMVSPPAETREQATRYIQQLCDQFQIDCPKDIHAV